jgi:DnaK suppressor protein
MTQEHTENIRKKLLALREERLDACRRQHADAAALLDNGVADTADQGLTDSLQDYLHLLGDAAREEVLAIDDALQRLRDGSYGSCENCGKAIEQARLDVLPFTRLCLQCQRQAECQKTARAETTRGKL